MNPKILFSRVVRLACFCVSIVVLALPAFAQGAAPAAASEMIVSTSPLKLEAVGGGISGQLVVAQEVIGTGGGGDLVYTLTIPPGHGRVGLAGGEQDDFFQNATGRSSYFVYQPETDFVGGDSFTYTVRSETSGLVFQNQVLVEVKPTAPVVLDKVVITGPRERSLAVQPVTLTTRPNHAVTQKIPSHEDFLKPEDRLGLANPKVVYALADEGKPQHGNVVLNRDTGVLTYSPNPEFIGKDRLNYYTFDENNPQLGVENVVIVNVEPIRELKHMVADRTKSRQVDLVFVINNSPSMAPHQARIAENLRRFRQLFDERRLDYRIGVLTTDFVNKGDPYYKEVKGIELDAAGKPVLDRKQQPKTIKKKVASNGTLVTLPALPQPWVTPSTPDSVFAELVKVGTNGDSNRTAFTSVYNFVANYQLKEHALLRPDATTIVVFFMDEEETRLAVWKDAKNNEPVRQAQGKGSEREAEWIEDGKLPALLNEYNQRHPDQRQTLDGYINYWVIRPFVIVKGNQRGKIEMDAVVSPTNVSHRRAAELTGGTVLNIDEDFSAPLAALGDRIADTVAVALDPVSPGGTLYKHSIHVLVDGAEVPQDAQNGWIYDERSNSIRFNGASKQQAFAARIEISYEEHR